MKPSHVIIIITGLLAAGVVLYLVTRPSTGGGSLLSGSGESEGSTTDDRTARDVGAVASGVGSGLGSLLSGIADIVRATRSPQQQAQESAASTT